MVKTPSVDKNGIKKGLWSEEEDYVLKTFVERHGHKNWRQLPKYAGEIIILNRQSLGSLQILLCSFL